MADQELVRRMALLLPGVGDLLSAKIAERFWSAEGVAESLRLMTFATRRDWESIIGIGPRRAAAIMSVLHRGESF